MITMIERRTNTMKKTRTQRENRTHKLNTTDDEGQVKAESLNRVPPEKEKEMVDVKESLGMPEKESTKGRKEPFGRKEIFPFDHPPNPDWSDAFMERIRRNKAMSAEERSARMQKV